MYMPKIRSKSNYNLKRERGWDNRFIYNNIFDNYASSNYKNFIKQKNTAIINPMTNPQTKNYFFQNHNSNNNNNKHNNNPNVNRPYSKQTYSFNINDDSFQSLEPYDKVTSLWNSLCVTETYKELFNVVSNQLDDTSRNTFYNNEISSLTNLHTNLNLLSQYLSSRETSLQNLKAYNDKLSSVLEEISHKSNETHLNLIINEITSLRINTVKVVDQFIKIRNEYAYSIDNGKYDMDSLGKKFLFDRNYLIKMKEEMAFLKEGYIRYFFNINESVDPFIMCASVDCNDTLQRKVPIDEELIKKIEMCQYNILQELIFYQNGGIKKGVVRTISPIKRKGGNVSAVKREMNRTGSGFFNKGGKKEKEVILINVRDVKKDDTECKGVRKENEKGNNKEEDVKKEKEGKNNNNNNGKSKSNGKELVYEEEMELKKNKDNEGVNNKENNIVNNDVVQDEVNKNDDIKEDIIVSKNENELHDSKINNPIKPD